MTKLTKAHRDLLSRAAAETLEASEESAKAAAALIKRGLLISIPRRRGASRLTITAAGRALLGQALEPAASAAGEADQPVNPRAAPPAKIPAAGGKVGLVVELLRRPAGGSIHELIEATGWQAHSIRGAIAGAVKKKLGLTVTSEKTERGRVYRIAEGAAA